MDAARWTQIEETFHRAVELPASERQAFLAHHCSEDQDLLVAVRTLLEEDARGESLLDSDISRIAHRVLRDDDRAALPFPEVGRYTVTERLGEGGMGVVYLAERHDLGSKVAIKVLRDAWVSPARRDRFASEQRMLAQLNHPFIARIYDADTLPDGTPWFAMEYVDGVSIAEYCHRRQCPVEERLRLFRDACEAVQYAHQRLIVHRDLKPSNLLVSTEGRVKLLDFGISRQIESLEPGADQARTLLRLMTPAYAAPEQVRGEPAGVQTDVYALGVVLYELLAGRRPFDLSNLTPGEAELIVLEREPDPPSAASQTREEAPAAGRGLWADLDVLCLTAMHKDPRRRYQSAEALIRDVDHFLKGEPLEARGDSIAYRGGKFVRRNWRALTAVAAGIVLVVGLSAFYAAGLESARKAALAEAARTQRIQRFMLDLFKGGEDAGAPARDLRVLALLDRGVQEARSLAGEPAIQAELLQTLGTLYRELGTYDQAESLLESALRQRRELLGEDHPDVVDSLVALGLLRLSQARLEDAERLVRDAFERARRGVAPDHPSRARATAILGRVLRDRGAYEEAVPLLQEAVRVYSASTAPTPELGAALTALANTHFYAGRLDESDALNRRVLALDRQMYGERHPNVAHDLINLGAIYSSRSRHAEAEGHYREALGILEAWYGPDHPETASAMTTLGQALLQQSRYEEATMLLRRALAVQERVHGPVHPRVAFVLNELGLMAFRRDHLEEAEAALGRALEVYSAIYEGKHSRVGIAMANLASVYLAREQYGRAERLFRDAIALYGEVLSADHLNTGIARVKLGRALLRQRRYTEAEAELTAGYQIVLAKGGPSATWLRAAREDLAATYDALKQPEHAARFRTELVAMDAGSR